MNKRALGNCGIETSVVGLGCMSLPSDAACEVIHCALDYGITLFDTADLYGFGENERVLGDALKGMRGNVVISTKVGNKWLEDGSWEWTPEPFYIRRAVEDSLQRLATDYIDVYMLHGGTMADQFEDIMDVMERLVDEGKILSYGISSVRPNVIRQISPSRMSALMTQYSLLDRRPEEHTLDICEQENIGVFVRGALAKGLLSGKSPSNYLNHSQPEVQAFLDATDAITGDPKLRAGIAMQFVLENNAVSSIVMGVSTKAQLEDNLASFSAISHLSIDFYAIKGAIHSHKYDNHRI